jgi:simple sugar transport system substrate-binding protein
MNVRRYRRGAARAAGIAVGFLAATISCSSLISCGARQNEPDGIHRLIGVSHANLTEPWRITMNRDILSEAATKSGLRVVFTDAADSASKQIDDISHLLELGVDLLIVSPVNGDALTPAVTAAYQKVPVILLDRTVEGYGYTLYIGPDNYFIGRSVGAYVKELLGPGGGRVVEIQGRAGSPPAQERSKGFREALADQGNIKIVDSFGADWLRDTAQNKFAAHLARDGHVDVVVAQNDTMAFGAARAARAARREGMRFIGIDGFAGEDGGIDLVRRGVLAATFASSTGGKQAVEYACDILDKVSGIPKKIFLSSRRVTAESLAKDHSRLALPEGGQRRIVLGYAQTGDESAWRTANTESIKAAAKRSNIDLRFVDCQLKQQNQIAAIRSFIAQRVDVIAFSPLVETGWDEVLREAKSAGIPVILSDRSIRSSDESLYETFLGADFVEEGRRAARWMISRLGDNAAVRIVELRGTDGSDPAIGRKKGFEEIIAAHPSYRIVASADGDFRESEGKRVMAQLLDRGLKDFNALYAHNDDMALGAIEAMKERGIHPGNDVTIVSNDAVRAAFEAMRSGELSCTVECNPLLGPLLMKAVSDYMSGKELPRRIITAEGVFPAETAAAALPERKY